MSRKGISHKAGDFAHDMVPAHATLYPLGYQEYLLSNPDERVLSHVASYATIRHHVIDGDFWDNLVIERQRLPKPRFLNEKRTTDSTLAVALTYDYLWCYRIHDPERAFLAQHTMKVGTRDSAVLLKVIK